MTTGRYIVEMEPALYEQHIAQSAKINAVALHINQAGILRVFSRSSIYFLHPIEESAFQILLFLLMAPS